MLAETVAGVERYDEGQLEGLVLNDVGGILSLDEQGKTDVDAEKTGNGKIVG